MLLKQLSCIFLLFSFLLLVLPTQLSAQNTSNKGRDFWLGYGNHVRGYLNPQKPGAFNTQRMVVYLTSDVNTTATVAIGGLNYSKSYEIKANEVTIAEIPQAAYLKDDGKYKLGIHLTAEKPIVVYAHIYNENVSGATLVLPTNTLGKDYYSINYTQQSVEDNSYSYFFVTAVEDNTEVEITPSRNTKGGWLANTSHIVNLNKGDIYQVLGAEGSKKEIYADLNPPDSPRVYKYFNLDLTGSRIRTISTTSSPCKKIAVFSGSGKTSIGCKDSLNSGDNLFQQIYPTAAWGKRFITVPLASRDYDIFRILRSDVTATVKLNGQLIDNELFVNGLYYEFPSKEINDIESDKPIQVVQYAVTTGNAFNCGFKYEGLRGDPEMIFLNPIDQVLKKITMYSTSAFNISDHYINVTISNQGVSSFMLDGVNVSGKFKTVPSVLDYSYAKLKVTAGTHNLSSDIGYNAIAYGFGPFESYGYAAGANLDLQSVEAISAVSKLSESAGCVGESFNFKVNLEYQTPKIIWNLDDGLPPTEQTFNAPDSTYIKDNQTIYVYRLNKETTYDEAKSHKVNVAITTNFDNQCGGTEIKEFDFDIYNPPKAKFSVSNAACLNEPITFADLSEGNGREIKSWLWDFGDGEISTAQNPLHIYKSVGDFSIKLTVKNESNCDPAIFLDTVSVGTIPVSKFSVSNPYCTNSKLKFIDQSTLLVGTIIKWYWDFGDGTLSELQNPEHVYPSAGTYIVKLVVETLIGCKSAQQPLTLNIGATPIVEFKMPDFCLKDGTANFKNLSTNVDGTITQLSYSWDFYNPYTNTHKFSSLRDASNIYTQTGIDYLVTLTLESIDGCPQSLTKKFTVNGSEPKADFSVGSSLCSEREIVFKDLSSVDFGSITKIEWYFDFQNKRTVDLLVEGDELKNNTEKIYKHIYPIFHLPANKSFDIKMVVYSGISCVSEKLKTITVNALPEVTFSSLTNVCENDRAFKLTQASEVNNMVGNGVYAGNGVNSITGMFDPATAGVGQHVITYTFTNSSGCSDSKMQTLNVFAKPLARNENMEVLEGLEYQLPAIADSNLVYKWDFTFDMNNSRILRPTIRPTEDIVYRLVVTNPNNCSAVGSVTVKVNKIPKIPNTFTPNGDNINDTWRIENLQTYSDCTVEVFNRYGKKVFSSIGYSGAWDGKMNGTDVPFGTYYYIINPKKGRKQTTGSVTILR